MLKPKDYDDTELFTGRMSLPPGGYVIQIYTAEEGKTKTNTPMLKITWDVYEGDYRRFMHDKWERNKKYRPGAGFPKDGTVFMPVLNRLSNTSKRFKGFVEAWRVSNQQDVDWDAPDFGRQFLDTLVGVVVRRKEEEFKGNRYWGIEPYYFCPVEKIRRGEFEIPDDKPIQLSYKRDSEPYSHEGFDYAGTDDDIPF